MIDTLYQNSETCDWGVTFADPDLEDCPMTYCNAAFEDITGHKLSDVKGRNCRFLQGVDTEIAAIWRLRRAIDTRTATSAAITNYAADGTRFNNLVFLNPVVLADGKMLIMGTQFAFVKETDPAKLETYVRDRFASHENMAGVGLSRSVQQSDQIRMKIEAVMMLARNHILRDQNRVRWDRHLKLLEGQRF